MDEVKDEDDQHQPRRRQKSALQPMQEQRQTGLVTPAEGLITSPVSLQFQLA
jgi:hypothetical protein